MQVDPTEVWLRDEFDGATFFPMENGCFNLLELGVSSYTNLIVEGRTAVQTPASSLASRLRSASGVTVCSTPTTSLPSPSFRSFIPQRKSSFSLKIVKARISSKHKGNSKPAFQPIGQMYVDITDSTANLQYIHACIQNQWGDEFTIATNDGLELEDSPATQGIYAECLRSRARRLQRT